MNDTIHHDGKGGFETESFRARSSRVSNAKEIEKDGVTNFLTTPFIVGGLYPGRKESTEEFFKDVSHMTQFYNKGLLREFLEYDPPRANKVKKEVMNTIHFLDTPAGRNWDNIISWRIAQKENKKK